MKKTNLIYNVLLVLTILVFLSCEKKTTEPDNTPPTVTITQPANGETLIEAVIIKADAVDNESVEKVEFIIDGIIVGEDNEEPYDYMWNVYYYADGQIHTILAKAYDNSDNVGQSSVVQVTVSEDISICPVLISPENQYSAYYLSPVDFVWTNVNEAINYELLIASDEQFNSIEYITTVNDTFVKIEELNPGTFYWKVRAVNEVGLYSNYSLTYSFFLSSSFMKTFGGNETDRGNSVLQTEDGGYIIVGNTMSYTSRWGNAWIIKTGISGDEMWNKTTVGGAGYSVKQTNDGGFIIAGHDESYEGDNAFIIKTDENGNEEWSKYFNNPDEGTGAISILQTEDGGYMFTGAIGGVFFEEDPFNLWLMKIDGIGNEVWNQNFGLDNCQDLGSSISETIDGGFIITGYTESFGAGNKDVWLIKTDSYGNEVWNRTFGGSDYDYGWSVVQTQDGGFVITGSTESFGAGYSDVWLIKTDGYGYEMWNKTFGGSNDDYGRSVVHTQDGGFIITGSTESFGAGYLDVWLIKTDSFGNEEWNKTFGGTDNDRGSSVSQTDEGGYIITGSTNSFGAGESDVWLIKTDSEGNVSE